VRDEKEDKKMNLRDVLLVLAVVVLVALIAGIAEPCLFTGHYPMFPMEYGCNGATWTAPVILCRAEFQVCRRCKLLYLERVEAEEGRKP